MNSILGLFAWKRAAKTAKAVLVEHLTDLKDVQIWFTGGVSINGAPMKKNMQLNALLTFTNLDKQKIYYDIPSDELDGLTTMNSMYAYAIKHIIKSIS